MINLSEITSEAEPRLYDYLLSTWSSNLADRVYNDMQLWGKESIVPRH